MSGTPPVLEGIGLVKTYGARRGGFRREAPVRAVDGVSLALHPGEALALVGESGCGKSTTARLLTRLVDPTAGVVRVDGVDVTRARGRALTPLRRAVQVVFQDPAGSLNPRRPAGRIISEPLSIHGVPGDHRQAVAHLMASVGLDPADAGRYPHAFSGGQRQRIGIARALALDPRVLVCDEPVSALDVSVQAQVLTLLDGLRRTRGLALLFISHDLAAVRQVADRLAVMYLGRIVETGPCEEVLAAPRHPYAVALRAAAPAEPGAPRRPRVVLHGDPPSAADRPSGCAFHPRCPRARQVSGRDDAVPEMCATAAPSLLPDGTGREVACWHPVPVAATAETAGR